MDFPGLLAQLLNGLQYGLLLFLIASGLTLIFGVMGVINLAHGSMFMLGAYLAYLVTARWGSLWLAVPAAAGSGAWLGEGVGNRPVVRLYPRDDPDARRLQFFFNFLVWEGSCHPVGHAL